MKKLAVIVPCYNEEAVIEESYRRTKEVLVSCRTLRRLSI